MNKGKFFLLFLAWFVAAAAGQDVNVILDQAHKAFRERDRASAKANAETVLRLEPGNAKAKALLRLIAAQEDNPSRLSEHNYLVPEVRYDAPLGVLLDDLAQKVEVLSQGTQHLNLVRAFPAEWSTQKVISLQLRQVPLRMVLQTVADLAGLTLRPERGVFVLEPKKLTGVVPVAVLAVKPPAVAVTPTAPPTAPADPSLLLLPDFLKNGIVVAERTQLSEAHLAAVAGAPQLSDAAPGAPLAYVRPGFVAQFERFQTHGGLTASLPVPVGAQMLTYATAASFARFGELDVPPQGKVRFAALPALPRPFVPKTMRVHVLTPETELLDPFHGRDVILSNGVGAMREAWTFEPALAGAPFFGLVKTDAGYFVGYLKDKNFGPPRFTWMQLQRENNWRFRLKGLRAVEIQKGTRLFEMADLKALKRPLRLTDTTREMHVTPRLYEVLLRSGMVGICADFDSPLDDGVDTIPAAPPAPPGGKVRIEVQKEMRLDSVVARFLQWGTAASQFTIEYVQEERSIYRDANGAVEKSRWSPAHLQKVVSIENDPDGGVRLTDRKQIYEFKPGGGGSMKLTVFMVEESPQFSTAPGKQR